VRYAEHRGTTGWGGDLVRMICSKGYGYWRAIGFLRRTRAARCASPKKSERVKAFRYSAGMPREGIANVKVIGLGQVIRRGAGPSPEARVKGALLASLREPGPISRRTHVFARSVFSQWFGRRYPRHRTRSQAVGGWRGFSGRVVPPRTPRCRHGGRNRKKEKWARSSPPRAGSAEGQESCPTIRQLRAGACAIGNRRPSVVRALGEAGLRTGSIGMRWLGGRSLNDEMDVEVRQVFRRRQIARADRRAILPDRLCGKAGSASSARPA